jgi:Retrotransposon gag protein
MADGLQAALLNHDRERRTTDIPLFFGNKTNETITLQQLIERIEIAAEVANWNTDERKCAEFFLCLREDALSWYNTLDHIIGFNKKVWADIKREFLAAYHPKFSARALCICFQDLKQKPDETVQKFYNRVSDTFINAYKVKPDHTTTYEGDLMERTQAEMDKAMGQGIERMQLLMMNTVFLGGLRDEIRTRVLEESPTKPQESVKAAREIESILNDKKSQPQRGFHVTSIDGTDEVDGTDMGEVNEEEAAHLQAINTILRKKGRPQYRFWVRPKQGWPKGADWIGPRDGLNGTGAIICFFCNKPGHCIAQCHAKAASGQGRGGGSGS